ncbi:hypothetical protein AAVH_41631 [Aphelenchoides avenae]|nr:hypothetical protein AAVH_41631 [Aphelenchus avenae]
MRRLPEEEVATAVLSKEPIHMIPVAKYPFDRVHADVLCGFPETERQNKVVLVVIDSFSKWLITVELPNQKASVISDAFVRHVICQHSVPRTVVTDQGRNFVGKIFSDLAKLYNFAHVQTTAYHQQANGMVERQNHTIANMVSAYVDKEGKQWDRYLALVTFAYNTAVQASTKQSPFYLLRMREAILPTDLAMRIEPRNLYETTTLYAQEMSEAIRNAWTTAAETMRKAQSKQKAYADEQRKTAEHRIEPTDLVLIYRDQPNPKECKKLTTRWDGPYRVLRVERPNVVVRQLYEDARPKKVHLDKVKLYNEATTLPLRAMDDPAEGAQDDDGQSDEGENIGSDRDETPIQDTEDTS